MTGHLTHNGSAAGRSFAQAYEAARDRQQANLSECVAQLLAQHHVAAVHPDDGWVDRRSNTVTLTYPALFAEPEIGDLIALGSETTGEQVIGRFRLVRVTSRHPASALLEAAGLPARTYSFEEAAPPFDLRRL
ncbi:MAG: hypothetical protein AB1760_15770 [Pseudomonadota bacterium]